MSSVADHPDAARDLPRRASTHPDSKVVAVLGPTNTGKTHLAIERMLGHRTGMIGFPLRLLARENYDRVCALKGADAVALVTGEEKIIPPHAAYFLCTVESMPLEREVGFLAIDEIQLCADRERGHIFTDRLLHARGRDETMFLGADTMKPVIARLVPDVEFIARPRFSKLTYAGPKKITRLPPRSAIVAFSAADVYSIAELIRRQRGGAAVVMGALSPRTRNAQVAMFQAGEVDYLVATDAIGMGLNMDVNHVAFAAIRKFDGHAMRLLQPNELAQIAGRAGRHMNDGTFGTTAEVGVLEPHVVEAIENHRFPTVKSVYWRARDLDFTNVESLKKSLDVPPTMADLIRKGDADDQLMLLQLSAEAEIASLADRPSRLKLLWEVCQVPDFRHALGEEHGRLLGRIFQYLVGAEACLPHDWVAGQIERLDRTDGDIDTLTARIDHVRTWNYVTQRPGWVRDEAHWQGVARALEDKLSDALHERLTQRFVDRRAAVLVKKLKDPGALLSSVAEDGGVAVEGHYVGQLAGFRFKPDAAAQDPEDKRANRALVHAAERALRGEIEKRVADFSTGAPGDIALDAEGRLSWRGAPVAQLVAGRNMLTPDVQLLPSDLLDADQQAALRRKLADWVEARLQRDLGPLLHLRAASEDAALPGALRGLLFQIMEGLGAVPRDSVSGQLGALDLEARKKLAQFGVRVGALHLFMPQLFGGRAVKRRALLWRVHNATTPELPPLLLAGQASVGLDGPLPPALLRGLGYVALGPRALRLDQAEKFAFAARQAARQGPFAPTAELAQLAGVAVEELEPLLTALGLRARRDEAGAVTFASRPAKGRRPPPRAAAPRAPRAQAPQDSSVASPTAESGEGGATDIAAEAATPADAAVGDAPARKKRRRRRKKPGIPAAVAAASSTEMPAHAEGELPQPALSDEASPESAAVADAPASADASASPDVAKRKRRRRRKKPAAAVAASTEATATPPVAATENAADASSETPAPVAAPDGAAPSSPDAPKRKRRRRRKKPAGEGGVPQAAADGVAAAESAAPRVDQPRPPRPNQHQPHPPRDGAAPRPFNGPRTNGPRTNGPRANGPRADGARKEWPRKDRPQGDRPQGDRPRGDRREKDGAPRHYSDPRPPRVNPDSPFAKLGEMLAARRPREPSDG
ncbi:MAG TPA: helicase-related protein [Alphaproteobacteria bacterium]|jgi:ATP-dependent RNA helicase SUPV3L1/SUV3